jgi:hypothetical protein
LLIFALPSTVPFAAISLLLAAMIAAIPSRSGRLLVYLISGALVGTMIGLWASLPDTEFDNRAVVVPGVVMVGVLCGYLEALASCKTNPPRLPITTSTPTPHSPE